MSRSVRIVLLCEDRRHETFTRRFLNEQGWNVRHLRPVISPPGRGSAERFVREQFPRELKALRAKGGEEVYLIVMIDGDNVGVAARRASLTSACAEQDIPTPGDDDRVLICVPTWNIETWLAYLGGEAVDEASNDYRHQAPEGNELRQRARYLSTMCRNRDLRSPSPPSLDDACARYRRVFE